MEESMSMKVKNKITNCIIILIVCLTETVTYRVVCGLSNMDRNVDEDIMYVLYGQSR